MNLQRKIEENIRSHLPEAQIVVSTKDNHHFEALVISELFQNKTLVARQRMVYAAVLQDIQEGRLHALAMVTKTPAEYVTKHASDTIGE